MLVRIVAGFVAGAVLLCAQTPAVEQGQAIFRSNCGFCHGLTGLGGRGPNLVSGEPKTDDEIKRIVTAGVPGSTMPAFSDFNSEQLTGIVAFLRSLAGTISSKEIVKGDSAKGRRVYEQNGCAACHRIGEEGSVYGPDLSRIGAARPVAYLRQSIVEPSADIPETYEGVTVVTADGRKITGVRVNEDTFSVQLRLSDQKFAGFLKDQLKEVSYPKQSLMPAFNSLALADLEDLIAYLKSLRLPPPGGDVHEAEGIK